MKSVLAIAAFVLCCATVNLAASAAPTPHVPKVGFLGASTAQQADHLLKAFKQGLRERGYEEGKNIVIVTRFADGQIKRLPALAVDLVALRVDVIFAPPTVAVHAARKATQIIPIVFTLVADPVGAGFVQSLAHPGGNITGLSTINVELGAKRLELLKEAVPKATHVAVLYSPDDSANVLQLSQTEQAAKVLAIRLLPVAVKKSDEFAPAFARMQHEGADALIVMENPVSFTHRDALVVLADKFRLPAMYALKEFVDAGGLMSYAASYPEQYHDAAAYVDKILKGAKPGDLPVQQPTRIEMSVNLKTAETQRFKFPQSLLLRADQVIR